MALTAGADVSTGAMVALVPRDPEEFAVGNEPAENLHVTISYLGKVADLSPKQQAHVLEVSEALSQKVPLRARVSGIAYLNNECTVILVDSPELRALHDEVIKAIGTKSSFPGYLPHLTVDYGDEVIDVGDLPEEIEFSHLRVALGGENHDFDGLAITADLLGKAREAASKVGRVFDEALHPRAKDGKWIEKDGFVKGVMTFRGKDGKPEVRRGVTAKVVDIRNGVVHVVNKDGERGVASARTLDEAAPPKADLRQALKNPVKPMTPEERRAQSVKAMADQAEKLTDDPEQRIPILNKIMGGLRGSPLTTIYEHNKQGPSGDEWSDERMAKHEEMWDSLLERIEAANVPRERRSLVLGGPPGAGKSFSLKPGEAAAGLGVVGWDLTGDAPEGVTHVVMNPDVIKELMIEFDMLPPDLPKEIRPREAASVTHAESNFLTMLFMSRLAALDINTVYDSTMANRGHVEKNIRALAEAGYTFQGLYVKIPKVESETSARNRYIEESLADPELGGRFVPSEASSAWDTEGTFKQFQSWFTDGWLMVDNTGLTKGQPRKEIYAQGEGNGSGLAFFLSPLPPPEHRPKRPPTRAGDPKQRSFWERPAAPSVIEPVPGKPKPVMWKPGMTVDEDGVVTIAAGTPHFLPLYTDTQAALGLFAGALSPDEYLELLRSNLVLVTPPVEDEEDYLWATTVFHEIHRLGRGGISVDVGDEYNRLRADGYMRDHDMTPVVEPVGLTLADDLGGGDVSTPPHMEP